MTLFQPPKRPLILYLCLIPKLNARKPAIANKEILQPVKQNKVNLPRRVGDAFFTNIKQRIWLA